MRNIYIHTSFIESSGKIPKELFKKIPKFLEQLKTDPSGRGVNLHSVEESMKDSQIYGAKLSESYRVIVYVSKRDDNYIVLYVDHHDEAYNWARNKRFEFKNNEIFLIQNTVATSLSFAEKNNENDSIGLFQRFSDEELFEAGIDSYLLSTMRKIQTKEDLVRVSKYFDEFVRSILFYMADGCSVDDAMERSITDHKNEEIPESKKLNTETLENIEIVNPTILKFNSEVEWEKIFADSLDKWRIYLHPSQEKIVRRKLTSALLVKGAAGTGKTIVLLHRIRHILESTGDKNILFLCFTSNLALEIRFLLQKLIGQDSDAIKVISLYEYAKDICKRTGWDGTIVQKMDENLKQVWDQVWVERGEEFPMDSIEAWEEYFEVKELNGIYDRQEYLDVIRKNRRRVQREDRIKIWNFFEKFEYKLISRNYLTAEQSVHKARLYLESSGKIQFQHVLVDEFQDMTLEALKLIRVLSGISEDSKHSLTLAGDSHQRIYRLSVSPSKAGIDLKGKSTRLKVNYRTSEEIRNFAHSILQSEKIVDFDSETVDTLGDRSIFSGPKPIVIQEKNPEKSLDILKESIEKLLSENYKQEEICIIYKSTNDKVLLDSIRKKDIQLYELTYSKTDNSSYPGVRIGTIHRIKGLEFRAVILYLSNFSFDETLSIYDKCELYVATTRARERLIVIGY